MVAYGWFLMREGSTKSVMAYIHINHELSTLSSTSANSFKIYLMRPCGFSDPLVVHSPETNNNE